MKAHAIDVANRSGIEWVFELRLRMNTVNFLTLISSWSISGSSGVQHGIDSVKSTMTEPQRQPKNNGVKMCSTFYSCHWYPSLGIASVSRCSVLRTVSIRPARETISLNDLLPSPHAFSILLQFIPVSFASIFYYLFIDLIRFWTHAYVVNGKWRVCERMICCRLVSKRRTILNSAQKYLIEKSQPVIEMIESKSR